MSRREYPDRPVVGVGAVVILVGALVWAMSSRGGKVADGGASPSPSQVAQSGGGADRGGCGCPVEDTGDLLTGEVPCPTAAEHPARRLMIAAAGEGLRSAFSRRGWSASYRSGRQDRSHDAVADKLKARHEPTAKSTGCRAATMILMPSIRLS